MPEVSIMDALWIALLKVYDNYKTPLGSHVVCWKSKLLNDGDKYLAYFIIGMTVNKMDTTHEYITYHMSMDHWDKVTVMQYKTAPPNSECKLHADVVERLLRL